MAVQKQDDQHEHTFSSYVRIRDVVLKTYLGRWTIGRSGERGSGISVLPARYDGDMMTYNVIFVGKCLLFVEDLVTSDSNSKYIWTVLRFASVYIYIYIYIERERERASKKERAYSLSSRGLVTINSCNYPTNDFIGERLSVSKRHSSFLWAILTYLETLALFVYVLMANEPYCAI